MTFTESGARATPTVVIFDGDDTLWSTEQLYDAARQTARAIVAAAGLDGAEWEVCQRRADIRNVSVLGYSPQRFPTSCRQAYEELCHAQSRAADPAVARQIESAARAVFECDPPLVPCAGAVLSALRENGATLALLTKGDTTVQERRVERSGLRDSFDMVVIVTEKTAASIASLVERLGGSSANAWMVGNSVRSDIIPALEAGLRAIWVEAHVWEHEKSHDHLVDKRVVRLSGLDAVPAIVAN